MCKKSFKEQLNYELIADLQEVLQKDWLEKSDVVIIREIANELRVRNLEAIAKNDFEIGIVIEDYLTNKGLTWLSKYVNLSTIQKRLIASYLTFEEPELLEEIDEIGKKLINWEEISLSEKLFISYYCL